MSLIRKYQKELEAGNNPRDYKMKLAFEIVRFYHSEIVAKNALNYFVSTFSKRETPDVLQEIKPSNYDIVTVLLESRFAPSKSEARRTIEQGGVKVNGVTVDDPKMILPEGAIVQKGKRFFVKVI